MQVVPIPITRAESIKIHRDHKRAAAVASLRYVSDAMPGIRRQKKGTGFSYLQDARPVKDKDILQRIHKLAIPPAWTKVWICLQENGHIQATGYDVRGRKQYKYHAQWSTIRNQTKFHRLYEFGKTLPALRHRIERDICATSLTKEKVLATVVRLVAQMSRSMR